MWCCVAYALQGEAGRKRKDQLDEEVLFDEIRCVHMGPSSVTPP